jgi:hypothetical protein
VRPVLGADNLAAISEPPRPVTGMACMNGWRGLVHLAQDTGSCELLVISQADMCSASVLPGVCPGDGRRSISSLEAESADAKMPTTSV